MTSLQASPSPPAGLLAATTLSSGTGGAGTPQQKSKRTFDETHAATVSANEHHSIATLPPPAISHPDAMQIDHGASSQQQQQDHELGERKEAPRSGGMHSTSSHQPTPKRAKMGDLAGEVAGSPASRSLAFSSAQQSHSSPTSTSLIKVSLQQSHVSPSSHLHSTAIGVAPASAHHHSPAASRGLFGGPLSTTGMDQSQPGQSILSSMNAPSMQSGEGGANVSATSSGSAHGSPRGPFPYSLPPVSSIRSPRRAVVCASLENAANASAVLTQTAIHPAILHSLSIRLQAMNDGEAEIVLGRLQQLAQHIDQQHHRIQSQHALKSAMQSAATSSPHRPHPPPSTATPHQQPPPSFRNPTGAASAPVGATAGSPMRQGIPSADSPMPALGSISSVDSGSTSNTTSPTISPAVGAQSGPPSPAMRVGLHQHPLSLLQKDSVMHPTHPHHPPLHPPAHTGSPSHGAVAHPHAKPSLQAVLRMPPPVSSASAGPGSSSLPRSHGPFIAPAPPSLVRGVSEDAGNIPAGLQMLIQALPGTAPGSKHAKAPPGKAEAATQAGRMPQTMGEAAAASSSGISGASSSTLGSPDSEAKRARHDAATMTGTYGGLGRYAKASLTEGLLGLPPPASLQRASSF